MLQGLQHLLLFFFSQLLNTWVHAMYSMILWLVWQEYLETIPWLFKNQLVNFFRLELACLLHKKFN